MTRTKSRLAASLIASILVMGALASCNTVRGAGQDVQAGGQAVSGAATDVQQDMQEKH